MESRRFALIAMLGVLIFFMYQAWENDYGNQAASQQTATSAPANNASAATTPANNTSGMANAPTAMPVAGSSSAKPVAQSAAVVATHTPAEARQAHQGLGEVTVQTDTFKAEIGLEGAGLRRVLLEKYSRSKDHPRQKLALLNDQVRNNKQPYFIFQQGLAGASQPLTKSTTVYSAARENYRLAPGATTLDVPLISTTASGYRIQTTYRFHRGSYVVDLIQHITNRGAAPLHVGPYTRWLRNTVQAGRKQKFVHTYFGLGVYQQDGKNDYKFEKTEFSDLDDKPYNVTQTGGWLAMLQPYFIAAVIPPKTDKVTYYAAPANTGRYYAQMVGSTAVVAPGATQTFKTRLYIGPKIQGKLDNIAPGLALTEDYGLFTPIAKPLFWVLSKFHDLTGNWGWAIVMLTFLVRLLFFKLSESQYRSMAKMRKFGPRIKTLRERHAGDREALNKAMMQLYKKEKFNPLAGCWPMLLQFPVFIALYYVIIESVELRQAPFIFWLQDLSAPDPYYILPIIYGITMWFQQRLSGQTATMEPTQRKIMSVMPIGLAGFFSLFPSGLVLYYCVSNGFTIVQQWVITRRLDKEGLGHR